MKLPRPFLHMARIADAVLFWPLLVYVIWGELTPEVPRYLEQTNDKLLHFMAYFLLAAMAAAAKTRSPVFAVIGLIALGGVLEIIQGFVGRDMSVYDELANALGAVAGGVAGRGAVQMLRQWSGYW
jgi:VanZ family protein